MPDIHVTGESVTAASCRAHLGSFSTLSLISDHVEKPKALHEKCSTANAKSLQLANGEFMKTTV